MKFRFLISIFFLLLPFLGLTKSGILDRVITIEIINTPIVNILNKIEEVGKVEFSYNPEIIDETKIVSLSIKEKTIEYGLSLIFDHSIRFKEVGIHIILLKNEDEDEVKTRKKTKSNYQFSGLIRDSQTGLPITGASIYDVDSRYASISNSKGEYLLTIPKEESIRSLYFKKEGYEESIIVINAEKDAYLVNNVTLIPIKEEIDKMDLSKVEKIDQPIEEKVFSGALISEETYIHSENLSDINETRIAQISLVPSLGIGSNLSTNGLITNNISLNILAGYSNGVYGVEVGGLLNMVKGNVVGCQIGGIANMVGGNVTGVQAGGIGNLIQGNVSGVQIGGVSSIVKGDVNGAQISGVSSIVRGGFKGLQLSGVSNLTFENSSGFQISGVCNIVRDSLWGGQISGVLNYSTGGTNKLQISSISNISGENTGLQISGIHNFAKENKGLQISLFNTSMRGEGIAIGLFNFVKEGYHKTEISANEIFPVNLVFKTGTKRLYNTYNFGLKFGPNPAYAVGLGFGSYFDLSDKFQLSLDLAGQIVNENQFQSVEFAQLYQFSTTLDFHLAKWITVFAGPSINANVMQFQNGNGEYISNIAFKPFHQKDFTNGSAKFWIGGHFGFRF